MKPAMGVWYAVLAVFLLGCQMCSSKELPRVEAFENASEIVEQFENAPEIVEQFENAPEIAANEQIGEIEYEPEFENALQQIEEFQNAPNEIKPVKPDRPINCWAGVIETPIKLICYGSCMTTYINHRKDFIGCSIYRKPSGCHRISREKKECFCNSELCNKP